MTQHPHPGCVYQAQCSLPLALSPPGEMRWEASSQKDPQFLTASNPEQSPLPQTFHPSLPLFPNPRSPCSPRGMSCSHRVFSLPVTRDTVTPRRGLAGGFWLQDVGTREWQGHSCGGPGTLGTHLSQQFPVWFQVGKSWGSPPAPLQCWDVSSRISGCAQKQSHLEKVLQSSRCRQLGGDQSAQHSVLGHTGHLGGCSAGWRNWECWTCICPLSVPSTCLSPPQFYPLLDYSWLFFTYSSTNWWVIYTYLYSILSIF